MEILFGKSDPAANDLGRVGVSMIPRFGQWRGCLVAATLTLITGYAAANGGAASGANERPPADVAAPPPTAQKLSSGLITKVLTRGRGTSHPGHNDCVKLHYTVWRADGSLLANSRRQSEPEQGCLLAMAPGLTEALKKMVVGEQVRAWVPARLTRTDLGEHGQPEVDETIDIELFEIIKAPAPPSDLRSPPPSATRLASGLVVRVLRRGTGTEHPRANGQVKLDFSGWTARGNLIESSVMAKHPAVFDLVGVIAGWREALLGMVVGEKVRLWIPAALAYGPKPRRGQPQGDLVYDLELLSIER
jgi:FKBP-type peptidyl-prolyl cis-trans isomerase